MQFLKILEMGVRQNMQKARSRPAGAWPATRQVRGSNYCFIGLGPAGVPGQMVVVSVIDNLVKGASGQALQNMNLLFGIDETEGLMLEPLYP